MDIPGDCPTPLELGRAGWDILHSSAAVYPYKPTKHQQEAMRNFILSWSELYACSWCAYHMRQYVREHPPIVSDKLATTRYVCELHNEVNERLGKDTYDCDPMQVLKRWHPGYPNKMEDRPSMEEQIASAKAREAEDRRRKQEEQAQQEARLTAFGWQAGKGRREPEVWRAERAATGAEEGAPATAATTTAAAAPSRNVDEGRRSSSRWWFFGGSAYDGNAKAGGAASASTARVRSSGSDGAAPAARPAKAADTETDVDAVLARLRGCQVYCPEDEAAGGGHAYAK